MMSLVVLTTYYGALILLTVFAVHRIVLVRTLARHSRRDPVVPVPASYPPVTIQLPLYNEPAVAARLIEAVAAIRYPARVTVQILDDSTDDTTRIIRETLASTDPPASMRLIHIRRDNRAGYKAGALSEGLEQSDDHHIAVFDADFVPPPDFLLRTMPHLCARDEVGMVQVRWGHLNAEHSLLTRIQSRYLDSHFAIESAARFLSGCFFNFNGTAGVWKRRAIESAGGWSADTVTEDLDLSYRSQRAGWKFVYLNETVAPAELPETLTTFQVQQFRWAKGSIQTGRKLLPSIIASRLPVRTRVEAAMHLTNNSSWPLTILLSALIVPAVMLRWEAGLTSFLAVDAALLVTSTASLFAFYRTGASRSQGKQLSVGELFLVMLFGIGLSASNSAAVISGLTSTGGVFKRTPKSGGSSIVIPDTAPRVPLAEALLSAWLLFSLVALVSIGAWACVAFVLLFALGFGVSLFFAAGEWKRWLSARIPLPL